MPPARPQRRKGVKFLDVKVLIGTLSAAVVIGLWNLLANNSLIAQKAAQTPPATPPPQPPVASGDLPPLPTLIPLIDVSSVTSAGETTSVSTPAGSQSPSLRVVAAPTQVIVQKVNPVIAQPVQVSGGSGGGAPKPVTTTRSSHP